MIFAEKIEDFNKKTILKLNKRKRTVLNLTQQD